MDAEKDAEREWKLIETILVERIMISWKVGYKKGLLRGAEIAESISTQGMASAEYAMDAHIYGKLMREEIVEAIKKEANNG